MFRGKEPHKNSEEPSLPPPNSKQQRSKVLVLRRKAGQQLLFLTFLGLIFASFPSWCLAGQNREGPSSLRSAQAASLPPGAPAGSDTEHTVLIQQPKASPAHTQV